MTALLQLTHEGRGGVWKLRRVWLTAELSRCLAEEVLVKEDGRLRKAAVAPGAVLPEQEPVPCPKVDGLAYGEAMGEASVVGARKGHNEFARLLHSPAYLHPYSRVVGKIQLWAHLCGLPSRIDSNMC